MIIAVGIMGKMQVPIHEEIRMVAMRYGFVAAIGIVDMRCIMAFAGMRGSTGFRVLSGNRKHVFVNVAVMRMVHVSVVQKVRVAVVLNPDMATGVIVFMSVRCVYRVTH